MLVFPAIGLFLWIAFLLAALVISGILWVFCQVALGILNVIERPNQKKVTRARRAPARVQRPVPDRAPALAPPRAAPPVRDRAPRPAPAPAPALASPDIWPKWTPAHR